MAIIICPDCNKEMSNSAKACPACGRPVQAERTVGFGLTVLLLVFPPFFGWLLWARKGHSTVSKIAAVVWLAVWVLVWIAVIHGRTHT